jgi:hypothetical protein
MITKYTRWPQNTNTRWPQNKPDVNKIYSKVRNILQHFPFQGSPKYTKIGIIGMQIYHLATLLNPPTHCPIRGRCYDHNFLQFFPIFGEKIGGFLKYQCYDQLFSKFCFVLSQKRQIFRQIFWRKYFKNHNIGPWIGSPLVLLVRNVVGACVLLRFFLSGFS